MEFGRNQLIDRNEGIIKITFRIMKQIQKNNWVIYKYGNQCFNYDNDYKFEYMIRNMIRKVN